MPPGLEFGTGQRDFAAVDAATAAADSTTATPPAAFATVSVKSLVGAVPRAASPPPPMPKLRTLLLPGGVRASAGADADAAWAAPPPVPGAGVAAPFESDRGRF